MATHRLNILSAFTLIDTSGEVFLQPYDVVDTGALISPLVLTFNDSGTKDGIRGSFIVPENYSSATTDPQVDIVWAASDTSTNTVTFDWSVLTRSGNEDMGDTLTRTTETDSTTKTATIFARQENNIVLTRADYVAGDTTLFELFRDTITDTMAAACLVFSVTWKYADA